MRSEGYSTNLVCMSVAKFSATGRHKTTKKLCQQVLFYTGLILKRITTAFKSYGVKTK